MITGLSHVVVVAQTAPDANRILGVIRPEVMALMGPMMVIMGVLMLITGGSKILRTVLAGTHATQGWASSIAALVMGGAVSSCGLFLSSVSKSKDGAADEPSTPVPTPSPTPTTPPSSLSLPQVENMGTLWLIPIVILSLIGIYLLVRRVRHDAQRIRTQREIAAATQERMEAKWQVVRDQHRRLVAKYLAAETEWDQIFLTPALTDPTVPQTAAMLQAMRSVTSVGDQMPLGIDETTDITELPYPRAVARFAQTWAAAESTAVKIGQSLIPAHERRAIEQIRQLLRIAEGTGSSPDERRSAYTRAMKMIQALTSVTVPEKARAAIEQSQRLMLDASTTSQPVPAGR